MNLEPEMAKRFANLMAYCPPQSVARGMVRMAEDTADEGNTEIAEHIWLTGCKEAVFDWKINTYVWSSNDAFATRQNIHISKSFTTFGT